MSKKNIQVEFTSEELRVIVAVLEQNPRSAYIAVSKNGGNAGGNVEYAIQARLTDRLTNVMCNQQAGVLCS